ncbi:MAG TPA: caspase family protein [Pyrinomonadaceae bacterium]|jgi:hypothetical protein
MNHPDARAEPAPQKWALLIGVNEYPRMQSRYHLKGCVNDVNAIEELLASEQFGFPRQNILKLTSPAGDGELLPTRANILEAFRKHLVENERIKASDIVVVYYSGHGSQIPDEEGDEEDGYDETIVPCDGGPDRSRREDVTDIRDDEISALLDELAARTTNINLFFDSCHSGSITRVMLAEEGLSEGQDRYLPPATYEVSPGLKARRSTVRSMGPSDWLPLSDGYVVITACRASERSREENFFSSFWFKRHGILTYYLLKAMRNVGAQSTYRDIWDEVRIEVSKRNPGQSPQLEGAFERKVFGGAALPRQRHLKVTGKEGDAVTLAAGIVHDATAGSVFAIYRPGTETFDDDRARVATLKLTAVGSFSSRGTVLEGDSSQVEIGAPAIEIEHSFGSMQMAVRVNGDGPVLETVRRFIDKSPLLALAQAKEQPSVATVELRQARASDSPGEAATDESLFILSSSSGYPFVEPVAPDNLAGPVVLDKLEHIAKYYNMLAIQNPDRHSNLREKIRLRLSKVLGSDDEGKEILAPLERNPGGDFVLKIGDRIVLSVENSADVQLYITLFDFTPQWSVKAIFPIAGASDNLIASNSVRRISRFKVKLPPHLQSLPKGSPLPKEIVKVMATTEPVDFRSIWLPATRGVRDEATAAEQQSSLYQLLEKAWGGSLRHVTRSMVRGAEPAVSDWATHEVMFHISD